MLNHIHSVNTLNYYYIYTFTRSVWQILLLNTQITYRSVLNVLHPISQFGEDEMEGSQTLKQRVCYDLFVYYKITEYSCFGLYNNFHRKWKHDTYGIYFLKRKVSMGHLKANDNVKAYGTCRWVIFIKPYIGNNLRLWRALLLIKPIILPLWKIFVFALQLRQ